jgi:hypothetical protein
LSASLGESLRNNQRDRSSAGTRTTSARIIVL